MTNPLRVAQWATGNIGLRSLRAIIEHPEMELVALKVHSSSKVGRDAGELLDLAATGVRATGSMADVIQARPDCVLYMRQGTDLDEICSILAAGINVVTTRGDFHHPRTMQADDLKRVEAACLAGRSSIYSTGSSPGFITEALTIPLVSLSRRLDHLLIEEFADLSRRDSPELIFKIMGFGAPPGDFDQRTVDHVKRDFAASLGQIADAVGLSCEEFTATGSFARARSETRIAAGIIPAGGVAAMRITTTGLCRGRPVMRFRSIWYCSNDIDEDWDLQSSGWRMQVQGDTPIDLTLGFPVPPDDFASFSPGLTAHRAVNAVAAVCAAPPGIRTTVDLPQVIARF